jgi:preprotein translocase subunit SecD
MSQEKKPDVNPRTTQFIRVFQAVLVLLITAGIGYFVYSNTVNEESRFPFHYGLDLAGGSQLVYVADVSSIDEQEIPELMDVLRVVIEKRVNVFGVSEPNVQVEKSSVVSGNVQHRLIVELPGVTDVDAAIEEIGKTPLLEFKLVDEEALAIQQAQENLQASMGTSGAAVGNVKINGESAEGQEASRQKGRRRLSRLVLPDATLKALLWNLPVQGVRFQTSRSFQLSLMKKGQSYLKPLPVIIPVKALLSFLMER